MPNCNATSAARGVWLVQSAAEIHSVRREVIGSRWRDVDFVRWEGDEEVLIWGVICAEPWCRFWAMKLGKNDNVTVGNAARRRRGDNNNRILAKRNSGLGCFLNAHSGRRSE